MVNVGGFECYTREEMMKELNITSSGAFTRFKKRTGLKAIPHGKSQVFRKVTFVAWLAKNEA